VCGSADHHEVHGGSIPIVRCRCGLVFAAIAPDSIDFDSHYQDRYPPEAFLPQAPRKLAKSERELRMLERLTDGRRILDVGSSYGFFLATAARRGWSAAGVELSAADAEYARCEYQLDVFVGRLEQSPYPRGSFDVVTVRHVLEHVPDPVGLLAEARRHLKPGGVLLVAVPNLGSLPARLFGADWWWIDPPTHLLYFDRASLTRCLQAGGFDVLRVETSRGDDEHTAFYALFVANARLNLMRRLKSGGANPVVPSAPDTSPHEGNGARSAARWATARRVMDRLAMPVRPLGWVSDRVGLGSEVLVVARSKKGAGDSQP
jgi:SAM-dependent methyltransferase